MLTDLPQPEAVALEHSAELVTKIRQRIAAAEDGLLSFADYMQMALYEPGLGYYSAGAAKFGPEGDFVTAPEISSFFSECLAGQCAEVLRSLGGGVILEPGAGRGVMAADMLRELDRLQMLPDQYLIIEPSADLRERQAALLQERVPQLAEWVCWLDRAPADPLRGVIVANEVVDALPVNRFTIENDQVMEICVTWRHDGLCESLRPAAGKLLTEVEALRVGPSLPEGYSSEMPLRSSAWVASVGDWLADGVALLFDYGFSRTEYYLPERGSGTLRCYYRHRAHENPYLWPGLQDITAWVDFSRLAAAADAAAMHVAGYTTQAQFLLAAGLDARVTAAVGSDPMAQARVAHGLRQLLLPGEMGDAVKVLALAKGMAEVPSAMRGRDMRSSL